MQWKNILQMFRVWKVSLEYLMGYLTKPVPAYFWDSKTPVFLHADSNENLLENLSGTVHTYNLLSFID